MTSGKSRGLACSVLGVLQQFPNAYFEVSAKTVDGLKVDSRSCLLIEQCHCISMQTGVPSNFADFELALPHQLGEVAFDHLNKKSRPE